MNGLPNIAGTLIGKANSLGSLIGAGLPLGEVSQLSSVLSSLSSSGKSQIKLPQVGFNTFARESITSQILSVLDNIKIPLPNLLGEISQEVSNAIDSISNISKEMYTVQDDLAQWDVMLEQAKNAFYNAERTLPQGDPSITQLHQAWIQMYNDPTYLALNKRASELQTVAVGLNVNSKDSGTSILSAIDNISSTLSGIQSNGSSSGGSDSLAGSLSGAANLLDTLASSSNDVSKVQSPSLVDQLANQSLAADAQYAKLKPQYDALFKATVDTLFVQEDLKNAWLDAVAREVPGSPGIASAKQSYLSALAAYKQADAAKVAFQTAHPEFG